MLERLGAFSPTEASISALVQLNVGDIPWPPDTIHNLQKFQVQGLQSRVHSDFDWWSFLGVENGRTFVDAFAESKLPPSIVELVRNSSAEPVVRYTLEYLGKDGRRRFARTLQVRRELVSALPAGVTDDLPIPFATLSTTTAINEEWTGLLELPSVDRVPVRLQWLPRARTLDEIRDDLLDAFADARSSSEELCDALSVLPLDRPPEPGDWHWWLHKVGQDAANQELERIAIAHLEVVAYGGGDADFRLRDLRRREEFVLDTHGAAEDLEALSSAERRWVDEAFAVAAESIRRFGRLAGLRAYAFGIATDAQLLDAISGIAEQVDQDLAVNEFWTDAIFDAVIRSLEPVLLAAARGQLSDLPDLWQRALFYGLYPALSLLDGEAEIRVVDEPEAHLDPLAQRTMVSALESIRRSVADVVVASHSSNFLGLPGWSLIHLRASSEGTTAVPLDHHDLVVDSRFAKDVGFTRGELLATTSYILIVEGAHDELILDTLFGMQFREAGIRIIRMHGTDNNFMQTADLDFVDRVLTLPIGLLLDYTRTDRIGKATYADPRHVTAEENKLIELKIARKRYGRIPDFFGLTRPDIVCYLDEELIRAQVPEFPGWRKVQVSFESLSSRPRFKQWLYDTYRVDLREYPQIQRAVEEMRSANVPPPKEMLQTVKTIISSASGDATQN